MRIAVCDDEKIFREKLYTYLNKYYKSLDIIIDSFPSGEKLLEKIQIDSHAYELIFLDIEMDRMDGLSTAKFIRQYNNDVFIVFLTSHLEFALEGYEVDAFRFLTKPVDENKLINALNDIESFRNANKRLLIKEADREVFIYVADIVYLEAQNVNIRIRTIKEEYVIRKSLTEMGGNLDKMVFFKTHRSYIINLKYVADYTNKVITMETGENVPLSRSKYAEFKDALMLYVKTCGK